MKEFSAILKICAKNKGTKRSKSVALQRIKKELSWIGVTVVMSAKIWRNPKARHNRRNSVFDGKTSRVNGKGLENKPKED